MHKLLTLVIISLLAFAGRTFAQANILDPNDPNVIFTSTYKPPAPPYGPMAKWGHTNRLNWNPYNYGYKSYYYKGMAFRLKFPKTYQHNVNDGKKYPVFVFLHGLGEPGPIWDNEFHLVHGAQDHANKVDNGTFDGFLFYPQSASGYLQNYGPLINEMIDSLAKYVKADVDRVTLSGLSSGGQAVFDIVESFPKTYSYITPISAARDEFIPKFPDIVHIPIWISNGGQDASPTPEGVVTVINAFRNLGGYIKQSFYPNGGHGIWGNFWAEPGYYQSLNDAHKANPLVYFQRSEFCPGEPVNAKLGLQQGFNAYQWERNGVVIPGATSNTYTATSFGTYRGRFRRTASSAWSEWSPKPVVISEKQPTITPPIQVDGLMSIVLPAPDGNNTVKLKVPNTYASYEWRRVSDNALVSTASTFAAPVGSYKVKVTEQYGCTSAFGDVFNVIPASGANAPDAAANLTAVALSNSEIQLNWNDNPAPLNNETAFEIYRSLQPGTGYALIAKLGADILTYNDTELAPATKYHYIVRAVNNNGASPLSLEVSAITKSDVIAPTAPANLIVTGTTRSSVSLKWDASTDDIGVDRYEIYVNGVKSYASQNTSFTVNNLEALQSYSFNVRALDSTGNVSPPSAQVNAVAKLNGLSYKYYHGTWENLPDFSTLTPEKEGISPNVTLDPRTRDDNFAFLWEGYIKIPTTGTYTFETNSDDGSKLYIGQYSHTATPVVNNDGLHGGQYRSGTIQLTAGIHPIAVTFFEAGGGQSMNIYWRNNVGINNRTAIPNSAFSDNVNPSGSVPNPPVNLVVNANSYKQITVSWSDNSNNEQGFEVVRGTSLNGTYIPIGTVAANTTTFVDSVGLEPATKYYYRVRSVNEFGESEWLNVMKASWLFNNNVNDETGSSNTLTRNGNPPYSTDRKEGSHSVSFNGSSQYMELGFSSSGRFPSDEFTKRTVGLWIKPASNNISGSNKIIFEFGGNSGGLALRFNSGALQAGIANGSNRVTASRSNLTSQSAWNTNGWNHVAVVFDGDRLRLYVNAQEVANANPSYSSVPSSSSVSRIGYTNSSNAFNSSTSSAYYSGLMDNFVILDEALNSDGIEALMTHSYGAATTNALPPLPGVPTALNATAVSPSKIQLTWNDNSNNEQYFQIERSVTNSNSFRLLAEVPGSALATGTYLDSNLFSNTNYYYRVRAVGIGGNSAFTASASAKTLNNLPVFAPVSSFSMRYSSTRNLNISATDLDGEVLSFSFGQPLPSFAVFNNTGNGTASITFSPSIAQQGTYPIQIIVTDGNNGKDTLVFTLTVNSNNVPVINDVLPVLASEGAITNVPLTANDLDGNATLSYSLSGHPAFATVIDNGNGSGILRLTPGFASAGDYTFSVNVSDGAGGIGTEEINLTVANVEPQSETVYMSMRYGSAPAPAPWNNIQTPNTVNLLNSNGQATTTGIEFLGTNWNAGDAGAVTGNNSGVYPDVVIRDYFWFGIYGAPETVTFNLKGLTPGTRYNVTLFGSSSWTGVPNNGTTIYTHNGVSKPLYVHQNSQNTVTFNNIQANASGLIPITMTKAAGTPYGVLTSVVLQKPFDDGTAPVLPANLAGEPLQNGYVRLTWTDIAYNENNYLVKRATNPAGPFTTLNPGATNANETTYIDQNVASGTTYYYKLEATNENGSSGETNVVSVLTINKAPVLTALSDVFMKGGNAGVVNLVATDDGADVLTYTVSNLPAFANFQNTGNGLGTITFNPTVNDLGDYRQIIVKVTDNNGASAADTFNLTVTDPAVRTVYINFGPEGSGAQPAPWNNFIGYPFANYNYGTLTDDAGVNTGFTFRYLTQWTGGLILGMQTGDDSGVYPDNVIRSSVYTTTNGNHTMQFQGLDPAKRYNIAFLNSFNSGQNNVVTYTSGSQSVSIDGKYNTTMLASMNGLVPNASGIVQVTLNKPSATTFLMLNAIVIQEYAASTPIVRPENLFAESVLKTNEVKLTWTDRSSNETGFQVYRATNISGPYSLVTTVAANVFTYTDNSVSANTAYYYRVRAVNGGVQSAYTNIAKVNVAQKIVLVNFNVDAAQNAPSPWNNTAGPSIQGAIFPNLVDQNLINTGFEMEITHSFNGAGFAGVNGAGVFPANVMVSNYWTDAGQLSQWKISNLHLKKKYRIGIFGSNANVQNSTANYTINGKTVMLNSYLNNSKVVYLNDISPDENGVIFLDCRTALGSPYSFHGAITIEYYDDDEAAPAMGRPSEEEHPYTQVEEVKGDVAGRAVAVKVEEPVRDNDISVFPNPFTQSIKVQLDTENRSTVVLQLFDMNSRLIHRSAALNTIPGKNVLSLDIPAGKPLNPGNYVLSVMIDGRLSKTVKLVKVN